MRNGFCASGLGPLAVAAVAALAFACAAPAPPSGLPASFDEALALASRTGKPVLLDFFTEW